MAPGPGEFEGVETTTTTKTTTPAITPTMHLSDLKGIKQYERGIWRTPYLKVYTIGGPDRVAEISNYPRAYEDTEPHLYDKDVEFTVQEDDLHWIENGERYFMDSRENLFRLGEKATHWKGDPLPGAFPRWLESETLPYLPTLDKHTFPIEKVPGPHKILIEAGVKVGDEYVALRPTDEAGLADQLSTDVIEFPKLAQDQDKQIIRIMYRRAPK